ncbi:amidohydrolase family protein [Variovorax sp. J2P1-59]|uniref:N-acyl-D-amino-acid deacylase family protein n=1 Tax=Variovorax flavidus TaxID=3053501 RepID=UPI002577DAE8|nr:amidohydrolase family protein [Variovorax sp. J2P1-59]MDM0074603.1 amidohydrolase family protein [Variovorax sp. J2P1-59]
MPISCVSSAPFSLRHAVAAIVSALACASPALHAADAPVQLDLIIRGGTLYTGDEDKPVTGDIGIAGDRIVFVGKPEAGRFSARRTIDATGLVVAPGFIDAHTHADRDLFTADAKKRLNVPFLTQGVTTAVIGNDGFGGFDIAAQAERLRSSGVGTNAAMYVGFGPVRIDQLGEANRAPTPAQLEVMKKHVSQAMCEGALGLSTGLFYNPQNFAKTEEVIELAKVAARHGGLYDSHIRDESMYNIGLKGSIDEVIRIGHEARLPVHVAHIKALGVDVQGQSGDIIRRIESERSRGLDITADQYPWTASSTRFSAALIPPWALDGGRAALLKHIDDPAAQERLRAGIRENLRLRGGPDAILFSAGSTRYVGKTLSQVAESTKTDPVDATLAVLKETDLLIASFNQSDDDIRAFMKRPWVMTSSDSSEGHPRAYGTFARKYDQYVAKEQVIGLAQFIRSSTSLTADTLGLAKRGHLRAGYYADILAFDPARYAAKATYTQPALLSEGVVTVLVNGELAVDGGKPTGATAGRPLLRTPKAGSCPAQ